jgi:hypothetical protein
MKSSKVLRNVAWVLALIAILVYMGKTEADDLQVCKYQDEIFAGHYKICYYVCPGNIAHYITTKNECPLEVVA